MQASFKDSRRNVQLKSVALAVALTLPNVASLAANMKDVVSTRAAQRIGEQYGRDSLFAFGPLSGGVKSLSAGPSGKAASLAVSGSAHSVDLFPVHRPQPYGRAGGYIGWERIVMMQLFPATVATSASQDMPIVKNGPRQGANVADLAAGDYIYRRKSAEKLNLVPATEESEGQSTADTNAIPEANKQPGSASAAPPEPIPQPADDMSAMEHPSGGEDDPNTEVQREPDPFTTEDHNSATARRESASMSATDNAGTDQSDPVVRALPEQAPLRPDDEGHLNVEDDHFEPVPLETSRDTNGTDNTSNDEADATTAIIVPLTAPSDGERESAAVATLGGEPARGAGEDQAMPEVMITVTAVGEDPRVEAKRDVETVK